MSEGSVVPYVRRTYTALFQAAANLSAVRVQYGQIRDLDEALGDNGRLEYIYWGAARSTAELRSMKATAHVKYQEKAEMDLFIEVCAREAVDDAADIEARLANLLGEVVKVVQTNPSTTSPGSHLHGISAWVDGWDLTSGVVASSGTPVYAATYQVTIHTQAFVEQ